MTWVVVTLCHVARSHTKYVPDSEKRDSLKVFSSTRILFDFLFVFVNVWIV